MNDAERPYACIPTSTWERLVVAATNHAVRQARYVDTSTVTGAVAAVESWLDSLENARVMPTPTPEPGDVLVKQDRGEIWMHDRNGWRELAPLELQTAREFIVSPPVGPEGVIHHVEEITNDEWARRVEAAQAERKVHESGWTEAAAQGADPCNAASGVATGPPPRFFGKSVVEEELGKMRAAREFPPPVKQALSELLDLENAIDATLEAAADTDLGNADRTLRSFKDGVDTSRRLLLDIATRDLRRDDD